MHLPSGLEPETPLGELTLYSTPPDSLLELVGMGLAAQSPRTLLLLSALLNGSYR